MSEIPKFPELQFEEQNHIYRLNGTPIPSVTTVMQQLTDAYYGGIDETVLNRAAKRGTAVHNAIENYLKYGIDDISEEYCGYYRAFKAFWHQISPKLVDCENRVYHRILRYAGTSDIACLVQNRLLCIDVKTSAEIVKMLTRVQLEAYRRAYNSHQITFDGKAILHLKRDGTYELDDGYDTIDTEAWDVYCGMLNVRNYIEKYRR